jgi:hypothetical protein
MFLKLCLELSLAIITKSLQLLQQVPVFIGEALLPKPSYFLKQIEQIFASFNSFWNFASFVIDIICFVGAVLPPLI